MLTKAEDIISCLLRAYCPDFHVCSSPRISGREKPDAADAVIHELCYMTQVLLEISVSHDIAEKFCRHQLFVEVDATKLENSEILSKILFTRDSF